MAASAWAVKTAFDKGAEGLNAANDKVSKALHDATGILPIANGGTGATDAAAARAALGVVSASLTASTFTRDQWQALKPETLLGTVHDGRYVAFFESTNRGLLFSIGARDVVRVELPYGWEVLGLYHHSEDDCVYVSVRTPEGCGVWRLEAGEPLVYRRRSKPFFTSALSAMAAVRVEGEQTARNTVRVAVFGPDGRRPRARLRLADNRAKRLPTTRAEKLWSLELSGTATVYEARLGGSVEGVEYAQ